MAVIKTRSGLLLWVAISASVALAYILGGFWKPVFWAIVLGIVLRPVMVWFETRWPGRPTLASALTVIGTLVAGALPALLLGSVMVSQGLSIYKKIETGAISSDRLSAWVDRLYQTSFGRWMTDIGLDLNTMTQKLQTGLLDASSFIMSLAANVGQNAASLMIGLVLMLYLLFFILRDGPDVYQELFIAVPMPTDQKQRFFQKFAEVSTATLAGTFVVGLVQGTLGGTMFALLGINGAVFWGVVMALMSLIPAVGSAVVWFPAAVILALGGSWIKALILLAFGGLVISTIDNLLRPMIVGHKTHMPDYVVLFATVGGISTLGVTGFVAGPIIAALFMVAWQLIAEEQP